MEERQVAVLGAMIAEPAGGSAFGLAGMMTELIEMVTSFGARIEQFMPSELVAVFGIEPMEDAARRAVLASHAMLKRSGGPRTRNTAVSRSMLAPT